MGRAPCCNKVGMHKGPWTATEDALLTKYIQCHGEGNWRHLPKKAGLLRCGKSCRLRWMNYLRPDIKLGNIKPEEEDLIIRLHTLLGNRWSLIAGRLPGRTDNEIKNYWNTHLSKKLKKLGVSIREGVAGAAPRRNHASKKGSNKRNNNNGSNASDKQDKRKKKKNNNVTEDQAKTTRTNILCPKPTRLATRSNVVEGSSNANRGSEATTSEEEKGEDICMQNLGGGMLQEVDNPNYTIAFEFPSFEFPMGDDLLLDRLYKDNWQLSNFEDDQVQMDFFAEPLFVV